MNKFTIIGTLTKQSFYILLDALDKMQRDGYVYTKHDRKDDGEWYVTIDYELTLTK